MELALLDRAWPTLAENLAVDEALLLAAEGGGPEALRFWEWPTTAVVLGAGGILAADVDEVACERDQVEIQRRSSGGGTVLLGRGCLCFSLILSFDRDPALRHVNPSYRWILDRFSRALAPIADLRMNGICDLVVAGRKCGGNAQQRKRTHLLHHGTLLYDFELELASRYLRMPDRQPEYRAHRTHAEFLLNLPVTAAVLRDRLITEWQATIGTFPDIEGRTDEVLKNRYQQADWVRRR